MARDDGVPMDLRRRVIDRAYCHLSGRAEVPEGDRDVELHYECGQLIDAVLTEIAAAGYALIATDRLERLQFAAGRYLEYCEDGGWDPLHREPSPIAMAGLHPGDLGGTS